MMRLTRHWFLALTCAVAMTSAARASDDKETSSGAQPAAPASAAPSAAAAAATSAAAVAEAGEADAVKGSLVIIGGALRTTDSSVMSEVVELAGGQGSKIAVFPTASSAPQLSGERMVAMLKKLGADAFVVPVGVMNIDVDYQTAVQDPELVSKVREADGVYFTGGSQARITQALLTKDGAHTPLLDAVWSVYRRGGVVAGSSAGAAIMSRIMFSHPQSVLNTLHQGVRMGVEIDKGLGFLDGDWFVEQHCLVRGRFARAMVAMQTAGVKFGVGIDEDSAVVVRKGTDMKVMGYKGALIFDMTEASRDNNQPKFNARNVKISYLDRGDSINLKTLEITPGEFKKTTPKVDPMAENFKPSLRKPLVANDILTNATICSVMWQTLVHQAGEGVGLAYDGAAARAGQAEGFEFRFYRDKGTCGWCADDEGYDSYTVANMRVDVEPVAITAPLYTRIGTPMTPVASGETGASPMSQAAIRTAAEPSAAGK